MFFKKKTAAPSFPASMLRCALRSSPIYIIYIYTHTHTHTHNHTHAHAHAHALTPTTHPQQLSSSPTCNVIGAYLQGQRA